MAAAGVGRRRAGDTDRRPRQGPHDRYEVRATRRSAAGDAYRQCAEPAHAVVLAWHRAVPRCAAGRPGRRDRLKERPVDEGRGVVGQRCRWSMGSLITAGTGRIRRFGTATVSPAGRWSQRTVTAVLWDEP